jgi:hypothetical protein
MEYSAAEMRVLFTWVHLSDIHVGHGDVSYGWDQQLVLAKLKEDIAAAAAEYETGIPAPDAIFITGDLAFSGATRDEAEYAAVRGWLSDISRSLSIDNSQIYIVPGNHDVQRNAVVGDTNLVRLLNALRSGQEAIDNVLADRSDRSLLAKRMKNYFEFAKEFGASSDPDLFWKQELTTRGLKIRIAGLNTALLSASDDDKEKLEVGLAQIKKALHPLPDRSKEVVLVLSHHPFDWLRDGKKVSEWTKNNAHVHLCGHIHEASSEALRSGGGASFLQIVSGAAHGERNPLNIPTGHGYNFGSLMADSEGRIVLRIWPRVWSQANTDFRIDVANTPRGRQFAEHSLNMRLPAGPVGGGVRVKGGAGGDVPPADCAVAAENPAGTVLPESQTEVPGEVRHTKLSKLHATVLVAGVVFIVGFVIIYWQVVTKSHRTGQVKTLQCAGRVSNERSRQKNFNADAGIEEGQKLPLQMTTVSNEQKPRLTKTDIVSSLRNGARRTAERIEPKGYVRRIQQYGVDFQITTTDEQEIRKAGSYLTAVQLDELITAVRANYRPEPTLLSGNIEQVVATQNPGGGVQVFLRLLIKNNGAPTAVQQYYLEIRHLTSKSIDFKSNPSALNERYTLPLGDGSGAIVIQPEDGIMRKTTESISAGQTVNGWLRFVLPLSLLTPEFMCQSGIRYALSFTDATGKSYSDTYETP